MELTICQMLLIKDRRGLVYTGRNQRYVVDVARNQLRVHTLIYQSSNDKNEH